MKQKKMSEKEARAIKEQTVKLDTFKGLAYKIAKVEIEYNGFYFCILDGIRTEVVK